jgi:hypothetical protein
MRRYTSSAVVSVVVHVVALIVLINIAGLNLRAEKVQIVNTKLTEVDRQFQFVQVLEASEIGSGPIDTASMFSGATSTAPNVAKDLNSKPIEDRMPDPTLKETPRVDLPTADKMDTKVRIVGESGNHVGGVGGAIDRITLEIARSLEQRKTLVIWVLDCTISLREARATVAKRFDRIYEELGLLGKADGDALLTAVVAFGDKTKFMTDQPTSDIATLRKAIADIKEDSTGTEHIFGAIDESIRKWTRYRTQGRRNVMVVAITDEAGDDEAKMEEVLRLAHDSRVPVYVLGTMATFGQRNVRVPYRSESGEVLGYPEVTRGPESAAIERVNLPYWFQAPPETFSAGFGPWALTRLCRETGGIYFVMNADEVPGVKFDPTDLRPYAPDYMPRAEYAKASQRSKLRSTVLKLADLLKVRTSDPVLLIPAYSEEAKMTAMRNGQEVAARLISQVNPALDMVKGLEGDRAREKSARWRANFDLIYGRLLATKVRAFCYNAVCADMKKKPKQFQREGNNAWRLMPDSKVPEDTPAGPALVKAAEEARRVLKRCVDENPNTPWAVLAQRELQNELSFRFEETSVPTPGAMAASNATPKPAPAPKAKPAAPPAAVPAKI